ncbi:hypothetical protein GPALN_004221 [Globodera pallida]|nr:hypothetical protein GPALN_004221 [Globodera pallida]
MFLRKRIISGGNCCIFLINGPSKKERATLKQPPEKERETEAQRKKLVELRCRLSHSAQSFGPFVGNFFLFASIQHLLISFFPFLFLFPPNWLIAFGSIDFHHRPYAVIIPRNPFENLQAVCKPKSLESSL